MDIKHYIKPLRKWWWLLIISMLVAAVSSLLVVMRQPNTYESKATLMVGNYITNPNPNSNEYYLAQQLASSYADIANRETVQMETMKALGLEYLPSNSTRAIPNTSLIEIAVVDTDPQRAQAVANELVYQLINNSPSSSKPEEVERQNFVNTQLVALQSQITETQNEISDLQQKLSNATSASDITDSQNQITALQQVLLTQQANYSSLMATTQQGSTNTISVIAPAGIPTNPIGPNRLMIVALASGIGLILASLAAYGIEYLDDTVRVTDDIQSLVNLPTLAKIGQINDKKNNSILIALENPLSPEVDNFRMLRMNLQSISNWQSLRTIMFTSAEPSVGKSVTISNLAVVMAQVGIRVILVEADLRKPSLHKLFEVSNDLGLKDLIVESDLLISSCLKATKIDNLKILPCGSKPISSVEALGSERMRIIMKELSSFADIILIDSPPALMFSDAFLMGKLVSGVVIISRTGRTRTELLKTVVNDLRMAGINLLGVVIQHQNSSNMYGYKYYHYTADSATKSEELIIRPMDRKQKKSKGKT